MTGDDFAGLMADVASLLLGEPNPLLSKKKGIWRYGSHGSLEINIDKGLWHDFETDEKGGVVDLIARQTGRPKNGADGGVIDWLRDNGFSVDPPANGHAAAFHVVATWPYVDENGDELFQVQRLENGARGKDGKPEKTYRQRHSNGTGGWISNVQGVRQVPYRLPELIEAIASDRGVFIVEGEKCADALWALGIPATTNAGGASKWPDSLNSFFTGADVIVLPDNDKPGLAHAAKVADALAHVAAQIHTLILPGLPLKGDAIDWLKAGGTADALYDLVDHSSEVLPKPVGIVLSAAEFIEGFVPPDYLLDGIIQRRFVYSMTAPTGAGKTAIALRIAAHVALGVAVGVHGVERGKVLYLAGENPDDVRMRWIMLAETMAFDPRTVDVDFVAGAQPLNDLLHTRLYNEILQSGKLAFVVVDTAAAYGAETIVDENSNVQLGNHARSLRKLTELPGGPAVVCCTHPTKNAASDALLPRGGGAFIAEMDGNLVCVKRDSLVDLHWQGKFRGPDFDPVGFRLQTVTSELVKDSKGRKVPSVTATPITESDRALMDKAAMREEDQVMTTMADNKGASLAVLAAALGWTLSSGNPAKVRVQRVVLRLHADKLVKKARSGWVLTDLGTKTVEKLGNGADLAT